MKIHTYVKCDTCRKAVKWLRANGLAFEEIPIRETPPSPNELRRMLAFYDGDLRRLFNTSGQDYRALGIKDKLADLTPDEAMTLLAGNGNLIKRPFLLGGDGGLVGFREEEWAKALL